MLEWWMEGEWVSGFGCQVSALPFASEVSPS